MVCGVLELSNERAQLGGYRSRGHIDPVLSGTRDGGTVRLFCHGQGIPGSPMSYCSCELWRAQRDAELAARRGPDALVDEQTPRPASIDPELADVVNLAYGLASK